MTVSLIVAAGLNNEIGNCGKLVWDNKEDKAYFRKLTTGTTIIMGRKTWDSLGSPLKKRTNVVITRNESLVVPEGVHVYKSVADALEVFQGEVFIIGGSEIYKQALDAKIVDKVYLTRVNLRFPEANVFFEGFDSSQYVLESSENKENGGHTYCNYVYRKRVDEDQYLDLIKKVLKYGNETIDRTLVGTSSLFGETLMFDLASGFPLITTKKVYWKAVVNELLFFISGRTDSNILVKQGVRIWEGNTTREFLDKNELEHYKVGDMGPVYGFQWRHWGAEYRGCEADYTGEGFDQLSWCINEIKTNPSSRRLVISAYNVADLNKMVLPPCHVMFQFNVVDDKLSCLLTQRSADIGLGVPFNIASYSLLLMMVAQCCRLKPDKFYYNIGNAHIYNNHKESLAVQMGRTPFKAPTVKLNPEITNIDEFTPGDIHLYDYNHHDKIQMQMAV